MSFPKFETPTGAINGVNLVFFTSAPYTPGTLAVYRNGQLLLNAAGNPWVETDPSIGKFTIGSEELPLTGDAVAVFFIDTVASSAVEVDLLHGELQGPPALDGQLGLLAVAASLAAPMDLSAVLAPLSLAGQLEPAARLDGVLEDC